MHGVRDGCGGVGGFVAACSVFFFNFKFFVFLLFAFFLFTVHAVVVGCPKNIKQVYAQKFSIVVDKYLEHVLEKLPRCSIFEVSTLRTLYLEHL